MTAELFQNLTDACDEAGAAIRADRTRRRSITSYAYYTRGVSLTRSQITDKHIGKVDVISAGLLGAIAIDRSDSPLDPKRGRRFEARAEPTAITGDETPGLSEGAVAGVAVPADERRGRHGGRRPRQVRGDHGRQDLSLPAGAASSPAAAARCAAIPTRASAPAIPTMCRSAACRCSRRRWRCASGRPRTSAWSPSSTRARSARRSTRISTTSISASASACAMTLASRRSVSTWPCRSTGPWATPASRSTSASGRALTDDPPVPEPAKRGRAAAAEAGLAAVPRVAAGGPGRAGDRRPAGGRPVFRRARLGADRAGRAAMAELIDGRSARPPRQAAGRGP